MKFWNTVSLMGVQSHYDDKLTKRITLTNQFGFVALMIFLFSGINNYMIGDKTSSMIIWIFTIPCMSVFVMNKLGFHKINTSFLLFICSIAIFYFDSYSGVSSGTYLYHFPLILATAFVFDYKDKKLLFFHFSLPLILLIINILTHREIFKSDFLSELDKEKMFVFNLMFSATSIGFFMYLTIANNLKESNVFEQRMNERKATEIAIKAALNEKNILLSEIHHRVKNNLAIIASLFNLQLSAIENEEAKAILTDSKNRVKSMALIHDSLYKSDNLSEIDFEKYTKELIDEIQSSYPVINRKITVTIDISNITLDVKSAIPCGLILNELLTNSYKHAFLGRQQGAIHVQFSKTEKKIHLKMKDDGVGMQEGDDKKESLGMVVIHSLCDQLDGKCSFSYDNGTCFEMEFEQNIQS